MAVLSETDRKEKLNQLNGWQYQNNQIEKEYSLKDFKSALSFVNKLGEEAEKMDHHPDINIHSYNKVKITLSTHSEGGVTGKDFNLAEKIENLNI
ncbi:MAG: 4a-hydroxytetrahydrobiopterin dehydratase [Ignavibacteriaceae bacterium]